MQLIPNRFLFHISHPCRYASGIPDDEEDLFTLSEEYRIDNFAGMEDAENFADVRLAWNEGGLAIEVTVRGKQQPLVGDAGKPRHADGVSLWVDTRDARTSHRASRYCHQFHLLPTGGGPDHDEPAFVQQKVHRAAQDAPHAPAGTVPFRCRRTATGYRLAAYLPAEALTGFDPEQNPRLGLFYVVRDGELGEQLLGAAADMPYAEDPTLWGVLELVGAGGG
ncbi:MAG: hypothetical protein U0736_24960 [Gemmataceae bacterium]